ncbi:MAG: hypothetical protein UT90_C0010G0001 [Parcubacteria group bacterium GW2011_GWA1_40_21]|nr:MAG: hypothetical protein UT90_C0010G0001 [Parcubacteria group bacterium GW2011_GWA1_40_21]
MQTSAIRGVQELKINLLEISIDFFNINKLSECIISDEKCDGCHVLAVTEQDMLIKKACCVVSKSIVVLGSISETLLSSSCIAEEERVFLANNVRNLAYDIKVFLFTRSHIISSRDISICPICDCNNHKNIKTLSDIFISVIDIS